jgi:hypothetical protein
MHLIFRYLLIIVPLATYSYWLEQRAAQELEHLRHCSWLAHSACKIIQSFGRTIHWQNRDFGPKVQEKCEKTNTMLQQIDSTSEWQPTNNIVLQLATQLQQLKRACTLLDSLKAIERSTPSEDYSQWRILPCVDYSPTQRSSDSLDIDIFYFHYLMLGKNHTITINEQKIAQKDGVGVAQKVFSTAGEHRQRVAVSSFNPITGETREISKEFALKIYPK